MKLAFSRPTNTEASQALLFRAFSEQGYDGLQLKFDQYGSYLDEPERFTDDWGSFTGAASALILGCRLDDHGTQLLRKTMQFAKAVGAERIVFCHGEQRSGLPSDYVTRFARHLTELGKEANEHGVRLSLHHHYGQPIMNQEEIRQFFANVSDDSVHLTVDTAHLAKSGVTDIADVITEFSSVIDNFHLKDYQNGEFRVLGEGIIDFHPVFQAIRQVGYDGWLSADEESGCDILKGMTNCRSFIASHLEIVSDG